MSLEKDRKLDLFTKKISNTFKSFRYAIFVAQVHKNEDKIFQISVEQY